MPIVKSAFFLLHQLLRRIHQLVQFIRPPQFRFAWHGENSPFTHLLDRFQLQP